MAVLSIERLQNEGWRAYQQGEGWEHKPSRDTDAYFWSRGWLLARSGNPWQQLFIAIFYQVTYQRQGAVTLRWNQSREWFRENNFVAGSCASYLNGHRVH